MICLQSCGWIGMRFTALEPKPIETIWHDVCILRSPKNTVFMPNKNEHTLYLPRELKQPEIAMMNQLLEGFIWIFICVCSRCLSKQSPPKTAFKFRLELVPFIHFFRDAIRSFSIRDYE